jgi:hypothetical protein
MIKKPLPTNISVVLGQCLSPRYSEDHCLQGREDVQEEAGGSESNLLWFPSGIRAMTVAFRILCSA